jgi:PhnB protein
MNSQVKPIPSGFHTLTPHLVVKNASQAIEFYKKAFGAEEMSRAPGPDGKSLMHADLKIGDSRLFLVDEFP